MDVNKNSYTFIFAAAMVLVVAAVLSFAATSLKPFQKENVRQEKMQSILKSVNVNVTRTEAQKKYDELIKEELVVQEGSLKEGVNAFNIEMAKQVDRPPKKREAPLYVAEKNDSTYYILPLRGKGLWGPIWGYVSIKKDVSTVYGATFSHDSETPGLGAEIANASFQKQFNGKEILDKSGNFVSIKVTKKPAQGEHQVDGISGGTITSTGVQEMLQDCLKSYVNFLKENKPGAKKTTESASEDDKQKLAIKE